VFGGVERGTKKCFFEVCRDRSAGTLLPFVEQWIAAGSRVISDGWQSYNDIGAIQGGIYTHDVIIHEDHFVAPNDDEIHTQNICDCGEN
jgi:hypothetical protein